MNDKAERQAARVWTEDAQTKIQQTTEYPAKTARCSESLRPETNTAGAQIEVFALRDISGFDVTVSDLVGGLGNRRQRRYFGLCGKIHPHQSEIQFDSRIFIGRANSRCADSARSGPCKGRGFDFGKA